jgi:2',3'-cyclic-nucleotide 2'-phosphodiesterase (5'-nucleotidase family)
MRSISSGVYALLCLVFCVAVRAETTDVILLHTNDFHCAFERAEELESTITRLRARHPDALLFDAGDMFESKVPAVLLNKGRPVVKFMNRLGYDGMTLGDNAFDFLLSDIRQCMRDFHFPVLAANLFTKADGVPIALPYWIYHRNGAEIAVLGIYDEDPLDKAGLFFSDPAYVITHYVERLRARVDCVVILSHSGIKKDKKLAAAVPGIDLIIGGSSQEVLVQPIQEGKTWIVQAGAYGTHVGLVRLRIDTTHHRVVNCHATVIPTTKEE